MRKYKGGELTPRHIVCGRRYVRLLSEEHQDRFVRHPHNLGPVASTIRILRLLEGTYVIRLYQFDFRFAVS